MPTITVPDDVYQRLAARAAAAGTTVEALAVPTLARATAISHVSSTREDRIRAFDELTKLIHTLMDGRLPPDFVHDDSRESIYEGCGES